MLNYIWLFMMLFGLVIGIMNGRINEVTKAAFDSAQAAVELCISLAGLICLWSGLMEIASKSGLINIIAGILRPVLKHLFPGIPDNHPAMNAMVMNITANFLGMGNAATPLGIKAMDELSRLDGSSGRASFAMSMFVILNTSAIQLIPATVIALRAAHGAKTASDIAAPVWVVSLCSVLVGITAVKALCGRKRRGR